MANAGGTAAKDAEVQRLSSALRREVADAAALRARADELDARVKETMSLAQAQADAAMQRLNETEAALATERERAESLRDEVARLRAESARLEDGLKESGAAAREAAHGVCALVDAALVIRSSVRRGRLQVALDSVAAAFARMGVDTQLSRVDGSDGSADGEEGGQSILSTADEKEEGDEVVAVVGGTVLTPVLLARLDAQISAAAETARVASQLGSRLRRVNSRMDRVHRRVVVGQSLAAADRDHLSALVEGLQTNLHEGERLLAAAEERECALRGETERRVAEARHMEERLDTVRSYG